MTTNEQRMKTVKQWEQFYTPLGGTGTSSKIIQAIQLDAYNAGRKAGMREAAEICGTCIDPLLDAGYHYGAGKCEQAILTAADAKEGK